jgi:hypothetical protein
MTLLKIPANPEVGMPTIRREPEPARFTAPVVLTAYLGIVVASATGLHFTAVAAEEGITIDLTYDSVMNMVRPEPRPNIAVHHNLQVKLSGNKLAESRDRSTGRYFDKASTIKEHGSDTGDVSWHVLDPRHLVRVQTFSQSTRKMTVTVNQDQTCHLEVVDDLKPGFQEYAFPRISVHSIGYFSDYRVVNTSCAIH